MGIDPSDIRTFPENITGAVLWMHFTWPGRFKEECRVYRLYFQGRRGLIRLEVKVDGLIFGRPY